MRTRIILTGALAVVIAVVVEIVGVLYSNGAVQHNIFGWSGGIAAVLGIIALRAGAARTRNTNSKEQRLCNRVDDEA